MENLILVIILLFLSVYLAVHIIAYAIAGIYMCLRCHKEKIKTNLVYKEVQTGESRNFNLLNRYLSGFASYMIIRTGKIPFMSVRMFLYRVIFCSKLKSKVLIYRNAEIRNPNALFIDEGSIIGNDVILDARNGIRIGKNVNFSTGVWLWTEQHAHESQTFALDNKKKGITIGDRAWLGPRVIVLPDVTIGEGAVIAAGAVVTHDIPPYVIAGGIPAKTLKERNRNLNYQFTGKHYPFQ